MAAIILEGFESSMTMDVSGALPSETPISSLVVDATAEYELSSAAMRACFMYTSDSLDVVDAPASDLKFFVDGTAFGALAVNVANASVDPSGGAIYSGADANKSYVCHDFVRYLASKLFNTHLGVDLFSNENALLTDIRANCGSREDAAGNGVWKVLSDKMVALETDASGGSEYDDASGNFSCQVFRQVITQFPARFENIENSKVPNSDKYYVPLVDGDTIQFKLTVNPAADQHTLTGGTTAIAARTYGITLVLKDTPAAISIAEE